MILHYEHLTTRHAVFQSMTGLSVRLFDELVVDLEAAYLAAEQSRLNRPDRRRTVGAVARSNRTA